MSYQSNGVTIGVTFDFSSGAIFGYSFILNDPAHGVLGTNVLADAASTIIDISSQVSKISTKGGYNLAQDQFEQSTATITVLDPNGNWNPQNTSSPYYGKILPLRKIRIFATYAGQTYFLFSGYTITYSYTYPKDQNIGYVVMECADAFRLFNMSNVAAIPLAIDGQDTGTRIGTILDSIQWPSSMRSIETGGTETICQVDPGTNRTALQTLKNVEFTEQGAFYVSGEGNTVFRSRAYIEGTSGKNPTVFANNGTGIPYFNLAFAFDDKLIINQATIQAIGGSAKSASNSASIATYFPHGRTQQNLVVKSDTDAQNIANIYVATRASTTIRIDAMTLDLTTPNYAAGITAALSLDYFNTVKITNVGQTTTTGGDSTITKTLQIMGSAMDITPNTWKITYTTSEPIVGSFILDSTLYGLLDNTDSVLSY
jgi:hypothetical protein